MKNDVMKKFRYRLFIKIALTVLSSTAIFLVFLFLADGVLNDYLANMTSYINRDFYVYVRNHKLQTLFAVFMITIVVSMCLTILKISKYISIIIESIDKVFQKDESLVELPNEFKDIENKLNTIKFDALKNEQIVKEAEQRKNDLVVYLAHDLKTPLTSVIGYLTLLNDEPEISPELKAKYLGISLDKAERLEELINEFFEITRFNMQNIVLERSAVNLSLMLWQLSDEFYPLLAVKNLECKCQLENNLTINGDPDKLARVFDNLLRNAINYSNENTVIDIFAYQNDDGICIQFRNSGKKIPAHKLSSIFEKFYRLDSSRSTQTGGAGLGLAIAREIIELHNGSISAVSNDEYTEFNIYLPIKS